MFVIGTAGHIDHGKSSIIMRLTGIDPDRLPEEKERGMTIDLGFAWYDTEDGQRIGIVDVPGHERFVKNMIAGAGGIDALILVVAADDGWMPQSQEHLQIARLLDIKHGLVVISKIDLVEESWVELVGEDIKDKLKNTFLSDAPIVKLSSETGEGFDDFKKELNNLAGKMINREDIGKPRLYVDRSFVLPGMGGVVAGTLRGGVFTAGMEVSVFPARKKGKIRILHSHNENVESSSPGQRTAVSLTGIDKQYLKRGSVVSTPEIVSTYPDNEVLALSVELIAESPVSIRDRRRLLLILGTTEVEGEARVFDGDEIKPGGTGYIFFKPFEAVLSFVGDRYIVRLPTPAVTVGGGTILDILNRFPRKKDKPDFEYLKDRTELTLDKLIDTEFLKSRSVDFKTDFLFSSYSISDINNKFSERKSRSEIIEYAGRAYRTGNLMEIGTQVEEGLKSYLEENPHTIGLGIDKIARQAGYPIVSIEPFLELMVQNKRLIKKGNLYDLPNRSVSIKGELKEVADLLETTLLKAEYAPPSLKELIGVDKTQKEAFDYLIAAGRVIKIGTNLAFHTDIWNLVIKTIGDMLDKGEKLTVATLREKLGSTRKYALPILEETDRLRLTERQGDIRIKGDKFEKI